LGQQPILKVENHIIKLGAIILKNQGGYNMKIYQFIRDKGGFENWDMIEIEKYNAIDKLESSKRERYWLEFYQATLNKQVPTQTNQEYRENNKNKIKEKRNIYKNDHQDEVSEYYHTYYLKNKDELNRKRLELYYRNKEQRLMGLEDKCVI